MFFTSHCLSIQMEPSYHISLLVYWMEPSYTSHCLSIKMEPSYHISLLIYPCGTELSHLPYSSLFMCSHLYYTANVVPMMNPTAACGGPFYPVIQLKAKFQTLAASWMVRQNPCSARWDRDERFLPLKGAEDVYISPEDA